jgi:hypothetical protein
MRMRTIQKTRISIALCLSLTLVLTGCASNSRQALPDQTETAGEPSPYRSYKWIKQERLWIGDCSETPARDALVEAGQVAVITVTVSLYIALAALYLFAPAAAGQCKATGFDMH